MTVRHAQMSNKKSKMPSKDTPGPAKKSVPAQNGGTVAGNEEYHGYLIRIADQQSRERAIGVFLYVPKSRCRVKDNCFLVTKDHIAALEKANIPFENIT